MQLNGCIVKKVINRNRFLYIFLLNMILSIFVLFFENKFYIIV